MPGLHQSRACDVPIACHNDKYWLLFSEERDESVHIFFRNPFEFVASKE